jgi:hypothetical protein
MVDRRSFGVRVSPPDNELGSCSCARREATARTYCLDFLPDLFTAFNGLRARKKSGKGRRRKHKVSNRNAHHLPAARCVCLLTIR